MGQDSSAGIVTCYGLDGPGIESVGWGGIFSTPIQTEPVAHPASYTMSTRSFLGVEQPGRGTDHAPPSGAKVEGRVQLPLWAFVACYRVNFTFTTSKTVLRPS